MSYESMAREDVCCDFPDCDKDYDTRSGKRVAIVKGKDEIIAFCKEHSARLLAEGVPLRVLKEIHDEMTEAREAPERRRREVERVAREKKFIDDLKK